MRAGKNSSPGKIRLVRYELPVHAPRIRLLDPHRDLAAAADLIELCFASTLDPDGREYLRQIRRAAADPGLVRWIPGSLERVSLPLFGYVWEEERRIVGNLSLIPIFRDGRWIYMIANVAVHPDFRRRGIGRALTLKAIEHVRHHRAQHCWLQVRDDNPSAIDLYREVGFIERSRRTTWICSTPTDLHDRPGIAVTARRRGDWPLQTAWLNRTYPPDVTWNLTIDPRRYNPFGLHRLLAWLNGEPQRHWVARLAGRPVGFASWEPVRSYADLVWVAADPQCEESALLALLSHARLDLLDRRRPTSINYPAGQAVQAFESCNFHPFNTLIWMEYLL